MVARSRSATPVRPKSSPDGKSRTPACGMSSQRLDRLSRLHVPWRHRSRCRRQRVGSHAPAQSSSMAPQEPNPALELGFTLEAKRPKEAQIVYEQFLARARFAAGHARTGAGRTQPEQARRGWAGLYERLLSVDPQGSRGAERDGLAGPGRTQPKSSARLSSMHVLEIEPTNEEAKTGLSNSRDVSAISSKPVAWWFRLMKAHRWGSQARGTAGITAFDTLELGWRHYSNELSTVSEISPLDPAVARHHFRLPSAGRHSAMPFPWYTTIVTTRRSPPSTGSKAAPTYTSPTICSGSGGYRWSFGAEQYDGHLIRTGITATVAPSWLVKRPRSMIRSRPRSKILATCGAVG